MNDKRLIKTKKRNRPFSRSCGRCRTLFQILVIALLIAIFGCKSETERAYTQKQPSIKPGVEVFLEEHVDLVKGKSVGLITNPSGVDSQLRSTVDLFYKNPDISLVALYGTEHGLKANAQPGVYVPFYMDENYNLPVFSLYGQSKKPEPGMLKNIDQYMRSFDILIEGKIPVDSMIKDLDVMVFDIQDVGTRIYVYLATMAFCMEACAQQDIEFIVLDRPNPINGNILEGPILEYPEYSTFVGLYPIPVRHGMTAGELAKLYNDQFLKKKVSLTVIPMEGWEREMWFEETSLPWVIPSPNMPSLDTATVYPGQVFLEGTNVSEGRGTTRPFEFFGAPWINPKKITEKLNALHLPGIVFRESWFIPTFSKYQGESCGGVQIHVSDRDLYRPFESTLHIIATIKTLYPDEFKFHPEYFDNIMGTSKVREALKRGDRVEEIIESYQAELDNFSELRKPYLLY